MTRLNPDYIREKFNNYDPIGDESARHFAILVPVIISEEREPELLYEVRSAKIDRQPGEICFPGGMIEEGESPLESALRETEEETGIPEESVEIITKLQGLTIGGSSQLHCYLGFVDEAVLESAKASEDEVHEMFTVPISRLLQTEPEVYFCGLRPEPDENFPYMKVLGKDSYPWAIGRYPVPVYDVDDRIIWGITGRITMEVLRCLR